MVYFFFEKNTPFFFVKLILFLILQHDFTDNYFLKLYKQNPKP